MKASRGMTLVEVLVALVVLSVGMLGVAALLVQGVQGSRSALLRTHAVNLVSDMADRIRANASAGDAYAGAAARFTCQPIQGVAGTNCSPAQLAADDVARWRDNVREVLPRISDAVPSATVLHFPGIPERYRVTVAWQEPQPNAAANQYSYSTDVLIMPRRGVP